jgi:hypothetical protein
MQQLTAKKTTTAATRRGVEDRIKWKQLKDMRVREERETIESLIRG